MIVIKNLLISILCFCVPCVACGEENSDHNWPQWRGPLGTGAAPAATPPLEWSATKNIRWKTELPGRGHSTPIVWGELIYLTTAVPFGEKLPPRYSGAPGAHDNLPVTSRHEFRVLAIRRRDGEIVWQKTVAKALPREGAHHSASLASASCVTDGEHLFAFFGSRGLFCFKLDGTLVWKKDLGQMQTKHGHGEGSTPALFGDSLVINWDHEGQSFVIAIDKRTGKQRWKINRSENTSWSSPIVVPVGESAQVIVCGSQSVKSYDLETGKLVWHCGGLSDNTVATPVADDGMVFLGSSYEKKALLAIKLAGAAGDITGSDHVVWRKHRGTPYVPSPLLYDGALYYLSHYQNILSRVEAASGRERPGAFRLGPLRNIYASPVAAAGRVYITDLAGTTLVIQHAKVPRVLSVNRLEEPINASAALVGNEIYLRGEKHLYCIAEEKQ